MPTQTPSPLTQLAKLSQDRFALTRQHQGFDDVRQYLMHALSAPHSSSDWLLIGTDGCHLCDTAWHTIHTASHTAPHPPTIIKLDLADSHDPRLIDTLGTLIPILVTPMQLLCYPFGVLDIIKLLSTHKPS
ncbi:hypothetical protein [Moraxella nasicaprae]|uniref:Thioredoxin family protein n=1 Tax=Moraxella nasicaprae TaxID=2904122 RepID=A0ABY6F342_9GAMM|nr:hypothetical protein [Moraxella nasicaprae]UXZ04507.1 hypothetical protein LU297_07960 [Moraxella nasicaprae]